MGKIDKSLYQEIILGALLHDIGKIVQRASLNPKEKRHQEFGYEWLKENFSGTLDTIGTYVLRHHSLSPTDRKYDTLHIDAEGFRGDLWIVCEADSLSSGERFKEEAEEVILEETKVHYEWNLYLPLSSIFWKLRLSDESRKTYRYLNQPLFYKAQILSHVIPFPDKDIELTRRDYQKILEEFHQICNKIVIKTEKELWHEAILNALEKCLSFIPSETLYISDNPETYPDVSLYDHLKTTAAIAASMTLFFSEEKGKTPGELSREEICDRKEERYLLVGGDISGIQDFIYTVTYKAALKGLRGRSFYLELLTEHLVNEIISNLSLPRASIIYSGGGSFYLLAPNTKETKQKIGEIRKEINSWLFKRHHGKIYFAIDWIELSGESFTNPELPNSIQKAWGKVSLKLDELKKRKFYEVLDDDFFRPTKPPERPCEVCGAPESKESKYDDPRTGEKMWLCIACNKLFELGENLPEANLITVSKTPGKESVQIGTYFYTPQKKKMNMKEIIRFYPINEFDEEAWHLPVFYVGKYPEKGGEEVTLENIVKRGLGANLLGTLRADVDNLGQLFYRGIPEKQASLSRLATLSRLLTLFFKRYINEICKGNTGKVEQLVLDGNRGKSREVVVVYSGGDDLFITGAWSDIAELAFDIRNCFRKYTCENPDIGISAGMILTQPNYPIYRIAHMAEIAEDAAKSIDGEFGRKDRVALFYVPPMPMETKDSNSTILKWDEWNELLENVISPLLKLGEFREKRFHPEFGRGTIYKLITASLMSRAIRDGSLILPIVVYTLSRAYSKKFEEEPYKKAWLKFVEPFVSKDIKKSVEFVKNLYLPLVWVDLLQRGGDKNE
jgi:CRISPR-associated protein Csm1